jgi:ABC-type polar amino acid transport system ATPase subunit
MEGSNAMTPREAGVDSAAVRVTGVDAKRGARTVLSGVDVEIARGEVIALMGPSGSGKTTILRAIAGLDPFERGTIVVDGVVLEAGAQRASVLRQLRRKVGMVFQFHCLFEHLAAAKNVWLAPVHAHGVPQADAERRAIELLRTLGVEHRAQAYPRELSGGEAQRVAIARALAVDPPVLLMDEPTASLDPIRRAELSAIVRGLVSRDRTIIVSTHDEEFARDTCTRVVRVSDGRVIETAAIER